MDHKHLVENNAHSVQNVKKNMETPIIILPPAYYGILTGDITISPRNEQTITAQRAFDNADGSKMKIIIGSQIASEGVDLRFVRETHVNRFMVSLK